MTAGRDRRFERVDGERVSISYKLLRKRNDRHRSIFYVCSRPRPNRGFRVSDLRPCVTVLCVIDPAEVDAVEGSSSGDRMSMRCKILVVGEETEFPMQREGCQMTATETARLLMLTESMVRLLARSGKIKAKKDGNAWQFDADDVLRWKAERPGRKPQDHPWRHGMVLGRQNWRCGKCSTLNTRRKVCSKCGAVKKEKADVLRQ